MWLNLYKGGTDTKLEDNYFCCVTNFEFLNYSLVLGLFCKQSAELRK